MVASDAEPVLRFGEGEQIVAAGDPDAGRAFQFGREPDLVPFEELGRGHRAPVRHVAAEADAPLPSPSRRTLLKGSLAALALSPLAAGCSPGGSVTPTAEAKNVRIGWWGGDFYVKFTNELIDLFRATDPGFTVTPEGTPWAGYWDKLAVQMAAGDQPDIINMDLQYLAEYAGRGALLDLETVSSLDLSHLTERDRELGRPGDKLVAALTGSNSFVVFANPALFAAAGVPMPDDTTWTWDDYAAVGKAINDSGVAAGGTNGGGSADLLVYLRQHGEDLYGDDEGLGFTAATLAAWLALHLELQEVGAVLSAAQAVEDEAATYEQRAFTIGKAAMAWAWTDQLAQARDGLGQENVTMLRAPSMSGGVAGNGMYFKASQYWCISARSANPELAGELINFLIHDSGVAKIQGIRRGVPSSPEVLAALRPNLTETELAVADMMATLSGEITEPTAIPAVGGSGTGALITRYMSEVRFKRLTPEAAADRVVADMKEMLRNAR